MLLEVICFPYFFPLFFIYFLRCASAIFFFLGSSWNLFRCRTNCYCACVVVPHFYSPSVIDGILALCVLHEPHSSDAKLNENDEQTKLAGMLCYIHYIRNSIPCFAYFCVYFSTLAASTHANDVKMEMATRRTKNGNRWLMPTYLPFWTKVGLSREYWKSLRWNREYNKELNDWVEKMNWWECMCVRCTRWEKIRYVFIDGIINWVGLLISMCGRPPDTDETIICPINTYVICVFALAFWHFNLKR